MPTKVFDLDLLTHLYSTTSPILARLEMFNTVLVQCPEQARDTRIMQVNILLGSMHKSFRFLHRTVSSSVCFPLHCPFPFHLCPSNILRKGL